jgi:hypothetical protein
MVHTSSSGVCPARRSPSHKCDLKGIGRRRIFDIPARHGEPGLLLAYFDLRWWGCCWGGGWRAGGRDDSDRWVEGDRRELANGAGTGKMDVGSSTGSILVLVF